MICMRTCDMHAHRHEREHVHAHASCVRGARDVCVARHIERAAMSARWAARGGGRHEAAGEERLDACVMRCMHE